MGTAVWFTQKRSFPAERQFSFFPCYIGKSCNFEGFNVPLGSMVGRTVALTFVCEILGIANPCYISRNPLYPEMALAQPDVNVRLDVPTILTKLRGYHGFTCSR